MSKSVLVMDTPGTCSECDFCFDIDIDLAYCLMASGDKSDSWRNIDCDHRQNKPDWCPLKELPEEEYYDGCDLWERGWNSGRNHLLKEIL